MTNHENAKAKFIERYGKPFELWAEKEWKQQFLIFLAGWTDSLEQPCGLCGKPTAGELITCRECHFGEGSCG